MNALTRVTESWPLHAPFEGPIVMIGFGSIGRGTLPLIERHMAFDRSKFVIIAPDNENQHLVGGRSLRFIQTAVGVAPECPHAEHNSSVPRAKASGAARAGRDNSAASRRRPGGVTAISCCGANPGMVSWLVKRALLDIARDLRIAHDEPQTREAWGRLMQRVGVKGIHIAERDTQRARTKDPRHVRQYMVSGGIYR